MTPTEVRARIAEIRARLRSAPAFALIWLVSAIGQAVETSERRKGRPPIT